MNSSIQIQAGIVTQGIGRGIRALRLSQDRSQGELAETAGLSRTILARIERGDGNPSIETLWRLATALRVPLEELVAADRSPSVRKIPAQEGEVLRRDAGMTARPVHSEGRTHRSELFELELPAGVEQQGEVHQPGTEELVVCVDGRMLAGPLDAEVELTDGDAAWFVADGPHRYAGVEQARALCWLLYPSAP